jgi:hypothetical protein
LLQENFNFALRLLEFFAAGGRKLHSFFEERERFLQGNVSLLQFLNYPFQTLETLFELSQRALPLGDILCNSLHRVQQNVCEYIVKFFALTYRRCLD